MPKKNVSTPRKKVEEMLFSLYRFSSEQLTEFFKGGSFDEFSIKANEFDVFCAFWVTTCYLRSTSDPVVADIENFSRSVIVSIADRIVANQPEGLDDEKIEALSKTITDVYVDRFSSYRQLFQADLGQRENGGVLSFPCLVEGFLDNVLDRKVPELSPVRRLLDTLLETLFTKSIRYFNGD